ncbi:hypothetical protein N8J89_39920 [Crossiella sp. CA-258035]|uniref:hypothetical protein n=1 Tax=Crossiella sp. CA-258035 TaxID=2981138 RepID=UPI0024BC99AD|nr:hypothetical protein [Crossiella sp. CA-258035]WHT19192.1 hypothetical protein N8J89_39920 [Crossiella sp. CA-258035]
MEEPLMTNARRTGALLLATAALLAGCTTVRGVAEAGDPVEGYDKRGSAARKVSSPGGELVSLLNPEPTAQLLCGTLSTQEWSELLGGPVQSRWAQRGGCLVEGGRQTVYLSLSWQQPCKTLANPQQVDVGGRPATSVAASGGGEVLCVPFNQFGEQELEKRKFGDSEDAVPKGTLHMTATPGSNPPKSPKQVLHELAQKLLAELTKPGPAAPAPGEKGALPYTPFPPPPAAGVVDLPHPQRAAALCTAASDEMFQSILGVPVRERQLTYGGDCTISGGEPFKGGAHTVWIQVLSTKLEGSLYNGAEISVAGRPAKVGSVLSGTGVLLRDNMDNLLAVRLMALGDNRTDEARRGLEKALAEQIVPKLLGAV